MSNPMEGEEVQYYVDGQIKTGVVKEGRIVAIQPTEKKKGKKAMVDEEAIVAPKKSKKKKGNGDALKKWREANPNFKAKRRSSSDMYWELKRLRDYHLKHLTDIEKRLAVYDKRVNAERRRQLLAELSTEQLEEMAKRATFMKEQKHK